MGYNPVSTWDGSQIYCSGKQFEQIQKLRRAISCSSSTSVPSLREATRTWSPIPSPINSPQGSPVSTPRTCLTPVNAWATSEPTTPSSASPKNKWADFLYDAACVGDLDHIALLIHSGAAINGSVTVKGIHKQFTPAKSGHLSPLAGAASHGQLAAARLLIQNGASINPSVPQSSSSPLHCACANDDIEMAIFLLMAGADVNLVNSYFSTPLMYAVSFGSPDLVQTLLEHRADINRVSFLKSAAIHSAMWRGSAKITELLIMAGANINHKMIDGSTPLHLAATAGHMSVVECLLRYGADPHRCNEEDRKAQELAEEQGHDEVAWLLADVSGWSAAICETKST